MNLTLAIVYVNGTAVTRIEGECLAKCAVEGEDGGRDIDAHRQILVSAFSEIHGTTDIDVLFPELGECIE